MQGGNVHQRGGGGGIEGGREGEGIEKYMYMFIRDRVREGGSVRGISLSQRVGGREGGMFIKR